jgi:hypothetical protein
MEKQTAELAHVEDPVEREVDINIHKPQMSETTYVGEDAERKKKSPAERKLVLKTDITIVPLAALIYFTAYLVCFCF